MAMKDFAKRYWYWIAVTVVVVVTAFVFADVPPHKLLQKRATVSRLEREIANYQRKITADSLFLEELKDDAKLEKFAREKFYMHAEGEEVYLFEQ